MGLEVAGIKSAEELPSRIDDSEITVNKESNTRENIETHIKEENAPAVECEKVADG